jgi:hypothetical protein
MIPDSAVQGYTEIKRQAVRSEDNVPVACSGLQFPVVARFRKGYQPWSKHHKGNLKIVLSVPSLLQAHRSIGADDLYCAIRDHPEVYFRLCPAPRQACTITRELAFLRCEFLFVILVPGIILAR